MYADDLLLSHGRVSALELTGAQSLPGYPALLPDVERAVRHDIDAPAGALDSPGQVGAHHRMLRTMWQAAAAGGPDERLRSRHHRKR